jgi:2'-5' RNA ligase
MIFVLAYPEFEPYIAAKIDQFRTIHEPERAKMVRPHITLVFGLADDTRKDVERQCHVVSGQTPEFDIKFDSHETSYDPFESNHKLVLRCGDGGHIVSALHDGLYDGPHRSGLRSDHVYRPHMTVATCSDRSDIERVNIADIGRLPIAGKVRALDLVQLETGSLTNLMSLPLQRQAGREATKPDHPG